MLLHFFWEIHFLHWLVRAGFLAMGCLEGNARASGLIFRAVIVQNKLYYNIPGIRFKKVVGGNRLIVDVRLDESKYE